VSEFDLEILKACPVCGSDNIPTAMSIGSTAGGLDVSVSISICHDCGQNFVNPRFTEEQTKEYYKGIYRDIISTGMAEKDQTTRDNQKLRARVQMAGLEKHLPCVVSALEIGSSFGYLLDELAQAGIAVVGVEPDQRYNDVEPANKYTTHNDISEVPGHEFDLIAMSHVLEHINKPMAYMKNIIDNYCHQGSLIIVEVPNTEFYPCYGIAHPFNYTEGTLLGMFTRLGCEILWYKTHGMDTRHYRKFLLGLFEVI
jgi:SAM-dependent methyltransferase